MNDSIEPLSEKSRRSWTRADIAAEVKSDFSFALFFLSPNLYPGAGFKELAQHLDIKIDRAYEYREKLLSSGFWKEHEEGIEVVVNYLDLGDLKPGEFMSMSLNVISRLTESGPCWYDSMMVVTNEKLKKEFYRKINKAFSELIEESVKAPPDTILSWNHGALDCIRDLKQRKS